MSVRDKSRRDGFSGRCSKRFIFEKNLEQRACVAGRRLNHRAAKLEGRASSTNRSNKRSLAIAPSSSPLNWETEIEAIDERLHSRVLGRRKG